MQKGVRVEVPVFDGSREPKDFIDWESSMNSYFRWYRMDTDLCVEYAEMRLGGQAKIFWENEYLAAERRGLPITTWAEMVQKLGKKYVQGSTRRHSSYHGLTFGRASHLFGTTYRPLRSVG